MEQFPIWKVCFVPKHAACQQLLATARNKQQKKSPISIYNVSTSFMWQGKPKGNPLPSLIFPCHQFLLLKELHSKRSLQLSWFLFVQKYKELHIFPFLFHWRPRELEFAQSSPDIWELILPRSEDEMLVKRRWKFYSSAAPTFSFHCFYFIHLILERKNKGKKQTPKQKTPNHNTTSPYKFTFKQSFVPAGYRNSDLLTQYILKIDKMH